MMKVKSVLICLFFQFFGETGFAMDPLDEIYAGYLDQPDLQVIVTDLSGKNTCFRAHQMVFAGYEYFKTSFSGSWGRDLARNEAESSESLEKIVRLKELDPIVFRDILFYLYHGRFKLDSDSDVSGLIEALDRFLMERACDQLLEQLLATDYFAKANVHTYAELLKVWALLPDGVDHKGALEVILFGFISARKDEMSTLPKFFLNSKRNDWLIARIQGCLNESAQRIPALLKMHDLYIAASLKQNNDVLTDLIVSTVEFEIEQTISRGLCQKNFFLNGLFKRRDLIIPKEIVNSFYDFDWAMTQAFKILKKKYPCLSFSLEPDFLDYLELRWKRGDIDPRPCSA